MFKNRSKVKEESIYVENQKKPWIDLQSGKDRRDQFSFETTTQKGDQLKDPMVFGNFQPIAFCK